MDFKHGVTLMATVGGLERESSIQSRWPRGGRTRVDGDYRPY